MQRSRAISIRALLGWCALAALLWPFAGRIDRQLRAGGVVSGSESALVVRAMATQFATQGASRALLVMIGLRDSVNTESGRAEVRRLLQPLVTHLNVVSVASPATLLDTMLVGRDRHSAIAIIGVSSDDPAVIAALRAVTRDIVNRERPHNPQLRMQWTGQSPFVADVRESGAAALREAEWLAIPITMVVVLLAFGSLQLGIIALLTAALVIAIATGVSGALSVLVPPSALTKPLISIMGFALSMDYALLLTRWPVDASHEHTLHGRTMPVPGMSAAVRAVRMAGAVVACGFIGLTIAPTGELRSAAFVGVLVALLASAVSTTVIRHRAPAHTATAPTSAQRWQRWGATITRHPWSVLAASAVPLIALALQAFSARLLTPIAGWLPPAAEAVQALTELDRMQRGGVVGTSTVLLSLPVGTDVLSPSGWTALEALGMALRRLPGAGDVRSLATIGT